MGMEASINPFPYGHLNHKKVLLDLSTWPLYDVDFDPVAPHGIWGQSFDRDDLAVDGKVDRFGPEDVEVTTAAQAEGAIEGKYVDYMMATPFATAFKFSRFDANMAAPRSVAALS